MPHWPLSLTYQILSYFKNWRLENIHIYKWSCAVVNFSDTLPSKSLILI